MRDLVLLRFTLRAMRELGQGAARSVQVAPHRLVWHAGPQPLNGQAVHDLITDGWVRPSPDDHTIRITAWPNFAGSNPNGGHDG